MRVMNVILDIPSYVANNHRRLPEFNSKMELIILHEDDTCNFTVKEREQIMRLNRRLMILSAKNF